MRIVEVVISFGSGNTLKESESEFSYI